MGKHPFTAALKLQSHFKNQNNENNKQNILAPIDSAKLLLPHLSHAIVVMKMIYILHFYNVDT